MHSPLQPNFEPRDVPFYQSPSKEINSFYKISSEPSHYHMLTEQMMAECDQGVVALKLIVWFKCDPHHPVTYHLPLHLGETACSYNDLFHDITRNMADRNNAVFLDDVVFPDIVHSFHPTDVHRYTVKPVFLNEHITLFR